MELSYRNDLQSAGIIILTLFGGCVVLLSIFLGDPITVQKEGLRTPYPVLLYADKNTVCTSGAGEGCGCVATPPGGSLNLTAGPVPVRIF